MLKSLILPLALVSGAATCSAQHWEFGALGGANFLSSVNASGPAGSATAGFAPGAVFGAYVGQNLYTHFSGELRYEYLQSDLKLSSGGQTAQFSGAAHAVHYDLIWHTTRGESRVQYFAAVGGGIKLFRGTGTEQAYQPLSQFGYFTKTQAVKPMLSIGGGLNYQLTPKLFLRAEIRNFITPFPTQIITPAPGVKFGSVLNNLAPMIGINYVN